MTNKEVVRPEDITEIKHVFGEETRTAIKRVESLILVGAALSAPMAGVATTESNTEPMSKNAIVEKGEMSSQKLDFLSGGGGSNPFEYTNSEPENRIVDLRRWIVESTSWKPLSSEQLELAKGIVNEWQEKEFGPYEEKLRAMKGAKEERIAFCARVWYCRNETQILALNGKKISNDLTEKEIFDYVKGGKNDGVFCNKEGVPKVWVVVNDEKIENNIMKGFEEAIKWYEENGMSDILDSVSQNGMSVYYVAKTHPDSSAAIVWLDKWGQVCANIDFNNTNKLVNKDFWRNVSIVNMWVEPYGIRFYQVMDALQAYESESRNRGNCEVVKSLMAAHAAHGLLDGGIRDEFDDLDENFFVTADTFAKMYSDTGVTVDGADTRRLLWLMAEFAKIPGFESLKSVPTFVEAMKKKPTR